MGKFFSKTDNTKRNQECKATEMLINWWWKQNAMFFNFVNNLEFWNFFNELNLPLLHDTQILLIQTHLVT